MTAQFPEKLVYNSQLVGMCATPLDDYWALINWQPDFLANCTGLWRGYVGGWLIEEQRIYLYEITNAKLFNGDEVTLETLFPDNDGKVFAHWFSGIIRIPRGELMKYFHGGFASVYERDEYLEFKEGAFIDRWVVENMLHDAADRSSTRRHRLKSALNFLFR